MLQVESETENAVVNYADIVFVPVEDYVKILDKELLYLDARVAIEALFY